MTTIAYKDGVVAYDSRMTVGEVVLTDFCEKMLDADTAVFFMCGDADQEGAFIYSWMGGDELELPCDIEAIIVTGDAVEGAMVVDGKVRRHEIKGHWAIGSGAQFAIGAMDHGATAAEAVEIAKRDVFTGGEVRTYKINRA